jgi:hypothetical protein
MGIAEIMGLVVILSAGGILWGNLKAREIANIAIRDVCHAHGFLFLDDTVALESLWPVRDEEGHLRLRRVYAFEYSDTGHNRRRGSVTMVAASVHEMDIGPQPPEREDVS